MVNGLLEALRVEYKCSSILGLCRFAEEQIKFEKNYEPVFHEKYNIYTDKHANTQTLIK
jgi:hypothetical protein